MTRGTAARRSQKGVRVWLTYYLRLHFEAPKGGSSLLILQELVITKWVVLRYHNIAGNPTTFEWFSGHQGRVVELS